MQVAVTSMMTRWVELAEAAQANGRCQFHYWDGVQCPVENLPFRKTRCPKHEGRSSQF